MEPENPAETGGSVFHATALVLNKAGEKVQAGADAVAGKAADAAKSAGRAAKDAGQKLKGKSGS